MLSYQNLISQRTVKALTVFLSPTAIVSIVILSTTTTTMSTIAKPTPTVTAFPSCLSPPLQPRQSTSRPRHARSPLPPSIPPHVLQSHLHLPFHLPSFVLRPLPCLRPTLPPHGLPWTAISIVLASSSLRLRTPY